MDPFGGVWARGQAPDPQLTVLQPSGIVHQLRQGKQGFVQLLDPISRPAAETVQPGRRTPAGAGLRQDPGHVTGAVADQRQRLHAHGGDDQLAPLPFGQHPAPVIHDLRDHVVLSEMHPLMGRAGDRPGHAHLPGTVVGEQPRAQDPLASRYHAVRAGVAADQRPAEASPAAGPKGRQQLPRHPHKGIRLLPLQNGGIFPVAQGWAQLQRPGAQPCHGLRDQLAQAMGAGKGKADHGSAAGEDQFPKPGHIEPDGVFQIPVGIEHPLGCAGGAGGGLGDDPPDPALGDQQHPGGRPGQIRFCGEGQAPQLRQRIQPFRQTAVKAAALPFPRKKAVELAELNRLYRFPVQGIDLLLLHDERVQA